MPRCLGQLNLRETATVGMAMQLCLRDVLVAPCATEDQLHRFLAAVHSERGRDGLVEDLEVQHEAVARGRTRVLNNRLRNQVPDQLLCLIAPQRGVLGRAAGELDEGSCFGGTQRVDGGLYFLREDLQGGPLAWHGLEFGIG